MKNIEQELVSEITIKQNDNQQSLILCEDCWVILKSLLIKELGIRVEKDRIRSLGAKRPRKGGPTLKIKIERYGEQRFIQEFREIGMKQTLIYFSKLFDINPSTLRNYINNNYLTEEELKEKKKRLKKEEIKESELKEFIKCATYKELKHKEKTVELCNASCVSCAYKDRDGGMCAYSIITGKERVDIVDTHGRRCRHFVDRKDV